MSDGGEGKQGGGQMQMQDDTMQLPGVGGTDEKPIRGTLGDKEDESGVMLGMVPTWVTCWSSPYPTRMTLD